MSELKAYTFSNMEGRGLAEYYFKSEADKVIAEKDSEIARLNAIRKVHVEAIESMEAGLLQDDKEIRRQKHKRCLAMAKWCADVRELMHKLPVTDVEADRRRMKKCKWCRKWRNRWLAIAEKFKEAK